MIISFRKYKWQILAYIIYAAFIPLWLDEGLDLRHQEFWYGIIICYFAVPLILYAGYYIIKYKVLGNTPKENVHNSIEIVEPPKEEKDDGSQSLLDFAREHGKMKVHRNNDGLLDLCVFTDGKGMETKAYVTRSIKDYSVEDIQREKNVLSIITLDSGAYCLCKKWEIIDV